MRATDLASIGKFAQAPAIRRDTAKVISHIESVSRKGTDVSEHIAAVRAYLKSVNAALIAVEKEQKADASE